MVVKTRTVDCPSLEPHWVRGGGGGGGGGGGQDDSCMKTMGMLARKLE